MRTIKTNTDAKITIDNRTFECTTGETVPSTTIRIVLPNGVTVDATIITSPILGSVSTFGTVFIHTADGTTADGITERGFVSF